jgi:hypothetical protein
MAQSQKEPIEASTTLAGRSVPYRILISTRARRLRVTVADGQVSVTLPRGVPHGAAEKMLHEHADWVLKQLTRAAQPRRQDKALPPDVILLRGAVVQVVVIEEPGRQSRLRVQERGERPVLRVPPGEGKGGRALAVPWLKARAREELGAAADQWAVRMGVRFKSVTIRDQKTRWGSCSSRGTLSFNWRLVMAPPAVQTYVVIHELAHLKQPNHSPAFWQVVRQHYPEYKQARAWLRQIAALLRPADLA